MKMNNFLRLFCGNLQMIFVKILSPGVCYHPLLLKKWSAKIETRKGGKIRLHKKVRLQERSLVRSSGEVILGEGSEIGANSEVMASGKGCIVIEPSVFMNRNCTVVSCGRIEIGEGTAIGCNVTILDHDHHYVAQGKQPWNDVKIAPVRIGKNVWIGANSLILSGSEIGDNAVIAAGSMVKGKVPAAMLFVQKKPADIIPIVADAL
jgi:acetyltransferase-like isoleucine patch superfamily enzyme